jgi:hypothetical protein
MASGRKARAAADAAFRDAVGRALGCVSSDGLFVQPAPHSSLRVMAFHTPTGRSRLALRSGEYLFLSAEFHYDVVADPAARARVTVGAYIHTVFDAAGVRQFAYHYHPAGRGTDTVRTPHLHIYAPQPAGSDYLAKVHLPTGRVAIEDVVWMLLRDMGVAPRPPHDAPGRRHWTTVLEETRVTFTELRRWA